MPPTHRCLALFVASLAAAFASAATPDRETMARGEKLFLANCVICHGVTGLGAPGTYPPLAGSDWLAANRQGAIKAVVSGLKDEIVVNGQRYHGQMPAIVLDDAQAADVLSYVMNSWGNTAPVVTASEVKELRATTGFKTFADLKKSADYRPLPAAPEGFELRELVRLTDFGVRLVSDGQGGRLYIMGQAGGVWCYDPATGNLKQTIWSKDFPEMRPKEFQSLGMTRDAQGRLWIVTNQSVPTRPYETNEVTIYRTSAFNAEGDPVAPKVWFRVSYPWGVGFFNHGVSDLKFGPDGLLYVSSGSRTDAGETDKGHYHKAIKEFANVDNFAHMGETELTAAMWRLDPNAAQPKIEVIARGIRNAFSFNWDGSGNLFTVSNGPDAHAPEEMDFITPPKPGQEPEHHGFPYQLGDAPAGTKWYPHTPDAPAGLKFVLPVLNLGPVGIMYGKPTSTFNAHSSPTGLTWLDGAWPAGVRHGFLMGRLGSFVFGPGEEEEHGFDILHLKMERRPDGTWTTRTTTFMAPLGRPIDIHIAKPGVLYVLEYTRPHTLKGGAGWLPGRILELRVKGQ